MDVDQELPPEELEEIRIRCEQGVEDLRAVFGEKQEPQIDTDETRI